MPVSNTPISLFKTFYMGGFECANHRRHDRTRIDVIATTGHDLFAQEDYSLLADAKIRTVRDGLRWHLIEKAPFTYDWSSFLPMLEAAIATDTQVIWDLCHWGIPTDIDLLSSEFPARFAAFAKEAAALILKANLDAGNTAPQFYCPINEISFWSWVGGDEAHFDPFYEGRGPELKRQLVKASIEATRAVRSVDPSARFIQAEPIIHISPDQEDNAVQAAVHTASQYEAWDMLAGMSAPELGGAEDTLDLLGVNYYWNNQWVHEGDRTPPGHPRHRPLHRMLEQVWKRYSRPLLVTETGAELGSDVGWLGYVSSEVRQAQRLGVPVLGICIYPVMDYPGWDDDRHCFCGLILSTSDWSTRQLRRDLCDELAIQQQIVSAHTEKWSKLDKPVVFSPYS